MPNNPIEHGWHVVRVATRPMPQVAVAFEQFMRHEMQAKALRAMWQHLLPAAPRPRRVAAQTS